MNELILVRHGESKYNAHLTDYLDSELTPKGIEQARKTGQYLREEFPHIQDFVGITSPYIRCLQTSRILKEETGLNFIVHEGPREIMVSYQVAEVKNHRYLFPEFDWSHEHDLTFHNENAIQFVARMKAFHDTLKHERAIIISHGTPINTLYEFSVGLPGGADTTNYVKNCAISYVRKGEGIWFGKTVYET